MNGYRLVKGDMKSVSWSISVINMCVLLCQIMPFTHTLGKFAAKPRTLSAEGANEWRSHEKRRWAGH